MFPVNSSDHPLNTFRLDNIFTHLLTIHKYCNRQGLISFGRKKSKNNPLKQGMAVHALNTGIQETETRRPLVRSRPKLHSRNLP